MHCILPQNQTTPERVLSNPWSGKGFLEPQQYKVALDRVDGGSKSCDLFIDIYKERAKIEENHAAALRQWSLSSQRQICQSKEFGTNRKAWTDSIKVSEIIAKRHDAIAEGIQKNVVDKMIEYKKNNYGKSFIHLQKIKEFEKDFRKVQKSWLELLEKVNEAKETYHGASRKLQNAQNAVNAITTDVGYSDEEKSKAKTSLETREKNVAQYEANYQKAINATKEAQPNYEKNMFDVLRRTDEFETKRLDHFKSLFQAFQGATSTKNDTSHDDISAAFVTALQLHSTTADIEHWNKSYGSGTTTKWPTFEKFQS